MKKSQSKSALLTLLMVGFIALFATGCGDSREDFVATNTNNNVNNPGNTGNLVLRFAQAAPQAVGIVPSGTTTLRIDLHSGNPPTPQNLVETRTVTFATVVTLTEVPDNVVATRVTAFAADGSPSVILDAANVDVNPGGDVEVIFTDTTNVTLDAVTFSPDPANLIRYNNDRLENSAPVTALLAFSNGSQVNGVVNNTTTSFSVPTQFAFFNGSAIQPFTNFRSGRNTTATGSYTLGTTTVNDDIPVSYFGFFPFVDGSNFIDSEGGDFTGFYGVDFIDDSGVFSNVNQSASTTYSFESPAPVGLTINSATGQMTSTSDTPSGTFNVVVTWVDQRPASEGGTGLTFQDTVQFQVGLSG